MPAGLQERLTPDRRSDSDHPGTTGVAAVMEATHMCMVMRGVQKTLDCHQCNGRCVSGRAKKPAKSFQLDSPSTSFFLGTGEEDYIVL